MLRIPALPVAAVAGLCLALAVVFGLSAAGAGSPDRTAFGEPVSIEVRDLAAADSAAAVAAALTEIAEIEALTDPGSTAAPAERGVAALNAAAGAGPRPADPRLVELLGRAQTFCIWSQGAHGPLGGRLYDLWGLRRPPEGLPVPGDLTAGVAAAGCGGLRVDAEAGTVAVAAGGEIELHGFAVGFAVDRAVAVLRARGAGDGSVAVGGVVRAFGAGPPRTGWQFDPSVVLGLPLPLSEVRLDDEALAVVVADRRPLSIAGERFAPYVDQRSGRPATAARATVAVTELAVDAQALAVTMLITGNREGTLRLGNLRPTPSVLWLLGGGEGPPLIADFHWSRAKLK